MKNSQVSDAFTAAMESGDWQPAQAALARAIAAAADLAELAAKEKNAAALATQLLALGRLKAGRELAQKLLVHKSALVRLCAATALALIGETLSSDAISAISEHLVKPAPLPSQWQ